VAEWGLPNSLKYTANVMLLGASVLVVPAIIAAMPWDRRVFAPPGPQPGVPPPRREAHAPLGGTAPPGNPQPGNGQPDGQPGPSLPEATRSGNGAPETTPTGNAPSGNGAPGNAPTGNAPTGNAPTGNGAPGTTPVTSSAETRGRWRWWPGRASDW
jgi:hypothetical protein